MDPRERRHSRRLAFLFGVLLRLETAPEVGALPAEVSWAVQTGNSCLCSAIKEFQLFAWLHRRKRAEPELIIRGRHPDREVVRQHQQVGNQVQVHPPGSETCVRAEAIWSVPRTQMFIARGQGSGQYRMCRGPERRHPCSVRLSGRCRGVPRLAVHNSPRQSSSSRSGQTWGR